VCRCSHFQPQMAGGVGGNDGDDLDLRRDLDRELGADRTLHHMRHLASKMVPGADSHCELLETTTCCSSIAYYSAPTCLFSGGGNVGGALWALSPASDVGGGERLNPGEQTPRVENAVRVETLLQPAVEPGERRWQRVKASSGCGTPPAQRRAACRAGQGAPIGIIRRVRIPARPADPGDQGLTGKTERRGCAGNRQPPDHA